MMESGDGLVAVGELDLTSCIREHCDRVMNAVGGPVPWKGCNYSEDNPGDCAACIPEINGGKALFRKRVAEFKGHKALPEKDPQ